MRQPGISVSLCRIPASSRKWQVLVATPCLCPVHHVLGLPHNTFLAVTARRQRDTAEEPAGAALPPPRTRGAGVRARVSPEALLPGSRPQWAAQTWKQRFSAQAAAERAPVFLFLLRRGGGELRPAPGTLARKGRRAWTGAGVRLAWGGSREGSLE